MTEFEAPSQQPRRKGQAIIAASLYVITGIVLPIVAFSCAAPNGSWAADSPWQNGEFWVYAALLLRWPSVLAFYPLLALSIVSMALFLWDRARFTKYLVVRVGIYGGVMIAMLFSWLIYAPTDHVAEAVAKTIVVVVIIIVASLTTVGLVWALFVILGAMLLQRYGWKRIAVFAAFGIGAVYFIAVLGGADPTVIFVPPVAIFIASLAASPAWTVAAYACASYKVYNEHAKSRGGWSLMSLMGISTWVVGLFGSWRAAMDLAIAHYAYLPKENPNCFVCSAAARGHRRFVGAVPIRLCDADVLWVNQQLRIFKAAEIVISVKSPKVHRILRGVYNAIGPRLARQLSAPWAADAAYMILKPAEWTARVVLGIAGVRRDSVARLYAGPIPAAALALTERHGRLPA